jgi:RNA polymerase sigma factor (sigma-70 family)
MSNSLPAQKSAQELEDTELVQRFKNGDRDFAFNLLVRRYQERVYWTVRRIVGTHEDADDVAQETFVTVWEKLDGFREDASFFTWLYRIAVNAALGHIRRRRVKRFVSLDTLLLPFVDKERRSDKQVLDSERVCAVETAIQSLPPQQRTVFCMRYYDGLKYEDIATMLGKSTGTLKANYHHAIKKLEVALKDEFAPTKT